MTCNNCGATTRLRTEFCPACGERIIVSMDQIIASTQDDYATRSGESLNGKLRAGIVILLVLLIFLCGFIYLYNKPLTYEGSGLPSIQANATFTSGGGNETLLKPYVDPRPLPPLPSPTSKVMGYRKDPIRSQLRSANGGSAREFTQAIDSGLTFLSKTQEKDGGWPVGVIPARWPQRETADFKWGRVGVTSLALLAMLGDGHSWPRDDAAVKVINSETVGNGIKYLVSLQDPATGRIGASEGHFMYNHAMATLALAEAAALNGDASLKSHVAKAVELIVKTQTPIGGWDYYGHLESNLADISVSAWPVQALAAAREAGVPVPQETFDRALSFFRKSTAGERGIYRIKDDENVYLPSRAGMVLMIRQLCGEPASNPDVVALRAKLGANQPKTKPDWGRGWAPGAKDASGTKDNAERANFDPYMLYFSTYGMFFAGGKEWEEWNTKMQKSFVEMQDIDGAWRTNDAYSGQGGTCYSTALCVLALQVHHRIPHSVPTQRVIAKDE